MRRILIYTQPGCLSCELVRLYLEANELAFDELDIIADPEAKRVMTEQHGSRETPTLVLFNGDQQEIVVGFDPVRLDHLLDPAQSSGAVTES